MKEKLSEVVFVIYIRGCPFWTGGMFILDRGTKELDVV
jgi:hypothetical protein